MRKILLMLLVMTGVAGAQTTATYTGVIKDLTNNVVTSGQVTFTLSPKTDATVSGVGRFTPLTVTCKINADGTLSGFVGGVPSGACIVTKNTALSPGGTSYRICIQPFFISPGSCFFDYATSDKDISTIAPTLSTGPINYGGVPGPKGDKGDQGAAGGGQAAGAALHGQVNADGTHFGATTWTTDATFSDITGMRNLTGSSVNSTQNPASGAGSYTADPTGVLDSTAAIQAALDTAFSSRNAAVELPAGTYKIGSTGVPLFMRPGVTLKGSGTGTSTLAPVNGRTATITSWTCAATSGTCTSGTGPYTLTLNLATPVFNGLQNFDSFCNPSGGTCQLFTYFGFIAGHGFYGIFGGPLTGASIGENRPILPTSNWWLATSFNIGVSTPPSANSGTGGTFFVPFNGFQTYDARNGFGVNATGYTIRDLTIDGGCVQCSSTALAYLDAPLSIQTRPGGGNPTFYVDGRIENVTIKNSPTTGILFLSTDTVRIRNLHCNTIAERCIDGQDASNMNIDTVIADNMGFPFHGNAAASHFTGIYNQLVSSATHGVTLRNLSFYPQTGDPNLTPFIISGFQNGANPDTYHRLAHDWIIDGIYQRDPCLQFGGIATVFVDNLEITNVIDDISNCSMTSAPVNSEGFIEIGGNNNHVSRGQNVHVTWAGITNDFTHASNIEIDHIQWRGFFLAYGVASVSGAQGGIQPAGCTISNVNIHDIQADFTLVGTSNASATIAGVGYGEGSANCTLHHVNVKNNQGRVDLTSGGTPSVFGAFMLLGAGDDYHFTGNITEGFANVIQANCENNLVPHNKNGTVVTNFLVDGNTADLAPASLVVNLTGGAGCPNNWTGVSSFGANTWATIDYNRPHSGVTGIITGSASSCVTGTASIQQALVGAQGNAVRTDGHAMLSDNTASVNVAANGTATVTVCSNPTAEPAGTYNVSATNPQ